MKFPYFSFEGQFLPVVPLKLKGKSEWVEFNALIDTGASFSLFHVDVAEILGLVLEEGEKKEMVLGDGNILTAYIHKIKASIADKEFVAAIGFSKGIGVGFDIIGRKDIFDNFIICFDEKDKQIEFKPN